MLLSEILEFESHNTHRIYLHLEGMFWKAYQRSAYLFLQHCRRYKVTKKFVKSMREEVVSLGFPNTAFDVLFPSSNSVVRISEKDIYVQCAAINEEAYATWFRSIALAVPVLKMRDRVQDNAPSIAVYSDTSKENQVVKYLREFRLESSTPMDCMNFVNKLKQIIQP